MKIKAGDWVKVECLENAVARVTQIDERGISVYIGKLMQNLYTGSFIKYITKLPIRFKGLNIEAKNADRLDWDCYRNTKSIGKIHFVCIQKGVEYFTGFRIPHESFVIKYCNTVNDAKDWLELQYATLIAKARGLV